MLNSKLKLQIKCIKNLSTFSQIFPIWLIKINTFGAYSFLKTYHTIENCIFLSEKGCVINKYNIFFREMRGNIFLQMMMYESDTKSLFYEID